MGDFNKHASETLDVINIRRLVANVCTQEYPTERLGVEVNEMQEPSHSYCEQ